MADEDTEKAEAKPAAKPKHDVKAEMALAWRLLSASVPATGSDSRGWRVDRSKWYERNKTYLES